MRYVDQRAKLTGSFHISGLSTLIQYRRRVLSANSPTRCSPSVRSSREWAPRRAGRPVRGHPSAVVPQPVHGTSIVVTGAAGRHGGGLIKQRDADHGRILEIAFVRRDLVRPEGRATAVTFRGLIEVPRSASSRTIRGCPLLEKRRELREVVTLALFEQIRRLRVQQLAISGGQGRIVAKVFVENMAPRDHSPPTSSKIRFPLF
jgi:hypothetical protein